MKLAEVSQKAYRIKLLMEYCRKSSVHGVTYWSDPHRPYWERFLWMILILVSLVMSGRMIRCSWEKWSGHALAFTLGSHAIHISEIPFPAFTVCSMARFRNDLVNYTEAITEYRTKGIMPSDLEDFDGVSQTCANSPPAEMFPKINSKNIYETLRRNQLDPEAMFAICNFVLENNSCSSYYQEVFTRHGRCYTFNGLNRHQIFRPGSIVPDDFESSTTPSNWTVSRGYLGLHEIYPLRAFQVMPFYGFTLRMRFNVTDGDMLCFPMGIGAIVQLHEPSEAPFMVERYRAITLEHYGRVVVRPEMITTAPELARYSPHERLCFFPGEKYLQHFSIYNSRNCRVECIANLTLEKCGCICGRGSVPCYQMVLRNLDRAILRNAGVENLSSCDCLPSCTSINYKFDLIQHKMFLWEKNRSQVNEVLIRIYFQRNTFIPFQRSELYGLTEFLASCGGILGLFMGVSVLSLAELFYFFPIRYLWNRSLEKSMAGQKVRPNVEYPRMIAVSPKTHVKIFVRPRF
uniref:Uncharacterized protein n=1 Tax=Phlebotomus papatasi TaxID=29031 RepID=A0A1B0D0V6_PHLPP